MYCIDSISIVISKGAEWEMTCILETPVAEGERWERIEPRRWVAIIRAMGTV